MDEAHKSNGIHAVVLPSRGYIRVFSRADILQAVQSDALPDASLCSMLHLVHLSVFALHLLSMDCQVMRSIEWLFCRLVGLE